MLKKQIAIIALMAVAMVSPAIAQDVKIAAASTARIFAQMQQTHDLQQQLNTERQQLEAQERQMREKITETKAKRDELRPDSAQYTERNQELMKASVEFEAWGRLWQAELQRRQKQEIKTLFDKIEAAVAEVAKQEGIDLVIADQRPEFPESLEGLKLDDVRMLISQRTVLYVNEKADISNKVIAYLDEQYKNGK